MVEQLEKHLITTLRQLDKDKLRKLVGDETFKLFNLHEDDTLDDEKAYEPIEQLLIEKLVTTSTLQVKKALQHELDRSIGKTWEEYLAILDYYSDRIATTDSEREVSLFEKKFSLDDTDAIFDFTTEMGLSEDDMFYLDTLGIYGIENGYSDVSFIVKARCDTPRRGIICVKFFSDTYTSASPIPLTLFTLSEERLFSILYTYTDRSSLYSLFGVEKADIEKLQNSDPS